jgi:V/A-type H+-transporting ATPase subunit C
MIGLSRRRGNYEYATTRVKAKKSYLLTKDNYPKLLMMDLNEIGRFMGETQYKVEMAELASHYSGVNLIELGTSRNLARTYTSIIRFCNGQLREMVAAYMLRWDVWNIKTIIRGKYSGASLEEIQEDLVPAGNLSEEYLLSLATLSGPTEILETLNKKGELSVPEEVVATFEKGGNLSPIEDYLDVLYYSQLLDRVKPTSKPARLFLSFIQQEIDVTNLRTLLKLKQAGVPTDKIRLYLIKGGRELDIDELTRLANIESFDQMLDEFSKLPFYEDIKEALEKAKRTGSLTEIMLSLQRYLAKQSEKFSHLYPLSVLPIIDYIIRKKIEVDNIRIIARGKASGLDQDVIKNLLVI